LVNARLDKAGTSTWKSMWKNNRVTVPADGCYEWLLQASANRPYFIQPLDCKPLFLAGLSTIPLGGEHHDGDGFVIVTDASDAGMLDIHDRRPLVLNAEEAKQRLDPETTSEEARADQRCPSFGKNEFAPRQEQDQGGCAGGT
jgi:putative SOS response-associated peptidase YedK